MGHSNVDVTQNVYGESRWVERVMRLPKLWNSWTNAAQNAGKKRKRISLSPSRTNGRPVKASVSPTRTTRRSWGAMHHCLRLALHETMHSHVQNRVARLFIEKPGPAN
jgi:hypothetical protein